MGKNKKKKCLYEVEAKSLIINRPERMSSIRKRSELMVFMGGWIIWFFICRPLIMLLFWFIGFKFLYIHMVELGGYEALANFWKVYCGIICVIILTIYFWNFYNKTRFRKKGRRVESKVVEGSELKSLFKLSDSPSNGLQDSHNITVDFLPKNEITFSAMNSKNKKIINGISHSSRKIL